MSILIFIGPPYFPSFLASSFTGALNHQILDTSVLPNCGRGPEVNYFILDLRSSSNNTIKIELKILFLVIMEVRRSLKNEITFFKIFFALAYTFRKCFQIRNINLFY